VLFIIIVGYNAYNAIIIVNVAIVKLCTLVNKISDTDDLFNSFLFSYDSK
jgi:hypothetical protein